MVKTFRPSLPIDSSEITPETLFWSRRKFMKLAGLVGISAALAACTNASPSLTPVEDSQDTPIPTRTATGVKAPGEDEQTPFENVTSYVNYYEFSTDKTEPVALSKNFKSSPWSVEVGGLVKKPRSFTTEDLLKYPQEERIYRLRCVEGWSMVIPWTGFPLSAILNEVEPTGEARYVAFTTLLDPVQMPGQKSPFFPWPYTEGLRLDEAMHDLTLLVTSVYGKPLPNQNGAPLRLAVPWKYGFKSIKAIVKIDLVADQPPTLWSSTAPNEYGFYANVNPDVPHPRWSQSSERRIGESSRRPTLLFNGYAEEVAYLYEGMDLKANY
jgi:sulfoxide reductase catalytic subunit YedY